MKSLLMLTCCRWAGARLKSPIPLCLVGLSAVPPSVGGEGLWGTNLSSRAG